MIAYDPSSCSHLRPAENPDDGPAFHLSFSSPQCLAPPQPSLYAVPAVYRFPLAAGLRTRDWDSPLRSNGILQLSCCSTGGVGAPLQFLTVISTECGWSCAAVRLGIRGGVHQPTRNCGGMPGPNLSSLKRRLMYWHHPSRCSFQWRGSLAPTGPAIDLRSRYTRQT